LEEEMMNWRRKLFGGGRKSETEGELAAIMKEQTGDPAFLHRTNWIVAYGRGDFESALNEVNQALQITPNDPYYLALCGMTHYSMKQYAQAHSYLKQALEKNPAQKEALDLKEAMKMDAMKSRDRARELGRRGISESA
jgi:tetratricopeptide (TPR) repeat protein